MSRFSSSKATSPGLRRIGHDHYRMFWTVDFYYRDSNLRWPRQFKRDTDEAGARRFAKRWGVKFPPAPTTHTEDAA